MSDSDSSSDYENKKSIDSDDNKKNKNINTNNQKKGNEPNQLSNVINNNQQDEEFEIENNDNINDHQKKNEHDSDIELKNKFSDTELNNKAQEESSKTEEKKIINFNMNSGIGNSLSSLINNNRRKDAIIMEIDEEKSKKNKFTVYQLIEVKNNSNLYLNDSNNKEKDKRILCFRRYSDFDKFYNALKFRYPHCIFPRLSGKKYINNEDKVFLELRRKELQYFINRLYFHEEISKSEEFKRFINSVFDPKYYDNLPKKYCYPECEKASNEKGYFSMGMSKLKGFLGKTKEKKQTENEKEILKREEEFKNKDTKYLELINEIKNLYESAQETKNEYNTISNNFLYIKTDEDKNYEIEEENNKNCFNELIELNQNLSKIYEQNTKQYLVDLMDQLNFCILDVEGINRAIERYRTFLEEYEKVKNTKKDNKYVAEEKSKIEKDKEEFESFLLKDLKKYDKDNKQIYEEIIAKLILYIQKINEEELESFNNTNFN